MRTSYSKNNNSNIIIKTNWVEPAWMGVESCTDEKEEEEEEEDFLHDKYDKIIRKLR